MKVAITLGAVLVVAMLGWVGHQTAAMNDKLDILSIQRATAPKKDTPMATLTTTWVDRNGFSHTVTTTKGADETDTQHAARHKAAVDAMLILYPKA